MAWSMQGFDIDTLSYGEGLAVTGGLVDLGTVLSANDGNLVGLQLCVAVSMRTGGQQSRKILTISTLPPAWSWWLYADQLNAQYARSSA